MAEDNSALMLVLGGLAAAGGYLYLKSGKGKEDMQQQPPQSSVIGVPVPVGYPYPYPYPYLGPRWRWPRERPRGCGRGEVGFWDHGRWRCRDFVRFDGRSDHKKEKPCRRGHIGHWDGGSWRCSSSNEYRPDFDRNRDRKQWDRVRDANFKPLPPLQGDRAPP